jgi:hypothetical protein
MKMQSNASDNILAEEQATALPRAAINWV